MANLLLSNPLHRFSEVSSAMWINVLSFGGTKELKGVLQTDRKINRIIKGLLLVESSFVELFKHYPPGKMESLVRSYAKCVYRIESNSSKIRSAEADEFISKRLNLIFKVKTSYHGACQNRSSYLYRFDESHVANLRAKGIDVLVTDLFVNITLKDSIYEMFLNRDEYRWNGEKFPEVPGFSYIPLSYVEHFQEIGMLEFITFEINWNGKRIEIDYMYGHSPDRKKVSVIGEDIRSNFDWRRVDNPEKFYSDERNIDWVKKVFCFSRPLARLAPSAAAPAAAPAISVVH